MRAVSVLVVACDVRTQTQLRQTTNRQLEGQQISLGFYPREITTLFQSSIVTVVNETATFSFNSRNFNIYNFTWSVRSFGSRAQSQGAFVFTQTIVIRFKVSETAPPKLFHAIILLYKRQNTNKLK